MPFLTLFVTLLLPLSLTYTHTHFLSVSAGQPTSLTKAWERWTRVFEASARAYKKKHGKAPTLIIDSISRIMTRCKRRNTCSLAGRGDQAAQITGLHSRPGQGLGRRWCRQDCVCAQYRPRADGIARLVGFCLGPCFCSFSVLFLCKFPFLFS